MSHLRAEGARLVFRADASVTIGAGHVMRSLTLASLAQSRGHVVSFYAAHMCPQLIQRASQLGIELVRTQHPAGSRQDAEALAGTAADLICVDGYSFSSGFMRTLEATGALIVAVDDNLEIPVNHADIVLNQNPHATAMMYQHARHARLLLGTCFAIIREEVRARIGRRAIRSKVEEVLVSMGGTDVAGMTIDIVRVLLRGTDLKIRVAVGLDKVNSRRVQSIMSKHPDRIVAIQAEELPAALHSADIAVLAAGSTLWEAAALGVPTVAVIVADNQAASACAPSVATFAIVHDGREFDVTDRIVWSVSALAKDRRLRSMMAEAGPALVDGDGALRAMAAFEQALVHIGDGKGGELS